MKHELVLFPNGTASVRPTGQMVAGEAMHSTIGAWREANLLYIDQTDIRDRLKENQPDPLVVYDVGMGIATNALAAISCAMATRDASENPSSQRLLRILSFEKDLDGLQVARAHAQHFPFFSGFESALDELVTAKRWTGPGVEWLLYEGDFRNASLGEPSPEVIFYDFYSPRSLNAELWGLDSFSRLFEACKARREAGLPVVLSTYSSATPVRVAMLLAGFFVGHGVSTGEKSATTVAATRLEDLKHPLGEEWLKKLSRSCKPMPRDWGLDRAEEARSRIANHPQFLYTPLK